MKKQILLATLAAIIFSGCSWSNPFGIGYEKSSCEMSSGFGVCGEPKQIYTHRDAIKKVQSDYMQSGYEESLYFGINDSGQILVKEEREGRWTLYNGSKVQEKINKKLKEKKTSLDNFESSKRISGQISMGQDIPVTAETDLSIKYKAQAPLIETRTNVGDIIRDNGLIQKIWVAPVIDSKKDLIAAHHIYLVVKEPKWIVGEDTPKQVKQNQVGIIPTPISTNVLKKVQTINEHQENVVNFYNNNNKGGLIEEINKDSQQDSNNEELNLINNFIQE